MIELDQVIKQVAKNLNVDRETVAVVCKHAFKETVEVMKSEDDCRDILFNQLFMFKLKRRYKEDKNQKYSSK